MALSINTNVASLVAQHRLEAGQAVLTTAVSHLSSGLRVTTARDDPAGLAIAERLRAQVRSMNVAIRNANDGISLAQTADGALGQVSNALQRMRELAVQARSDGNSVADRDALNQEFTALGQEISRTISGTSVNGRHIFGSDAGTMSFQIGAGTDSGDTVDLTLENLLANSTMTAVIPAAVAAVTPTAAQLTQANKDAKLGAAAADGVAAQVLSLNANYAPQATAGDAAKEAVRAALLASLGPTVAAALSDGIGKATSGAEARNIADANWQARYGTSAPTAGDVAEAAFDAFAATVPASSGASIAGTQSGDQIGQTIDALDAAIGFVGEQRGTFGALLNRLGNAIDSVRLSADNLAGARSHIVDADIAEETATLSRGQILQQAAMALVAQANQSPNAVLQLLR